MGEPDEDPQAKLHQPWGVVAPDPQPQVPAQPAPSEPAEPTGTHAPAPSGGPATGQARPAPGNGPELPGTVPVEVAADGATITVMDRHVAARGNVVETVLSSLTAIARATGQPVLSTVTDRRPGGYRQQIRVFDNGRSDLVWAEQPGSEPPAGAAQANPPAAVPPQQTPGYGYPQQTPPAGYGYPQPGAPAGYGYPQQGGPGPHPQYGEPGAGQAMLPTVNDLLAQQQGPRPQRTAGAAAGSGGLFGLLPSRGRKQEEAERQALLQRIRRPLDGPRTVVVVNPKGGAQKTTASLLLATSFGTALLGQTLAWDNNETRGTMSWRALPATHQRTVVDLLRDEPALAAQHGAPEGALGPLGGYVRPQGEAMFDVLASDEQVDNWSVVDGAAFRRLHGLLLRHYRFLVVDTGNNMRAPNWMAAVEAADALVVMATVRQDTAASAAWMLDALRTTEQRAKVANAVTVLAAPGPKRDGKYAESLVGHFGQHTRAVLEVPFDGALASGGAVVQAPLARATRLAWLRVAAAVADGL